MHSGNLLRQKTKFRCTLSLYLLFLELRQITLGKSTFWWFESLCLNSNEIFLPSTVINSTMAFWPVFIYRTQNKAEFFLRLAFSLIEAISTYYHNIFWVIIEAISTYYHIYILSHCKLLNVNGKKTGMSCSGRPIILHELLKVKDVKMTNKPLKSNNRNKSWCHFWV